MMTAVFQRIGPFEIIREIGRGGMATVFLALDTRSQSQVALKLVAVGTDRESRDVLEAEQWGAKLHDRFSKVCAHVPAVYEYQIEGQYFYIAMEYVDGQNLSTAIARGPLAYDRAVALTIDLCRVLEAAHTFETTIDERRFCSLIHGDLNPRNVRLSSNGTLKVLDFGIAKALSLSRRVTRNDFGSMPYLSPERLESDGNVDAMADCWAVGILLYEMLSGDRPFRAADTRQLEKRITSRQPPEPLPNCPAGLRAIVGKLLAPQLANRYADAKAIREDLERFVKGEKTEAESQGGLLLPPVVDEAATRRTRPAFEEPATARTPKAAAKATGVPPIPPPLPPPLVVPPPLPASARAPQRAPQRAFHRAPLPAPLPAAPAAPRRKPRTFLRKLRFALLIPALFMIVNEISVGNRAVRLRTQVAAQELDGLDSLWTQYDRLAQRSFLGLGIVPLEESLERQTRLLTDRVMARYRAGSSVVWEPEWSSARHALVRATAATGGSHYLRASLRYCDGHLYRINGEARKARRETEDAQRHFAHAVAAFRESAELRPDWPDPFLGLARTFIYGLEDVDLGADALKQAEKRGYTSGERETLQLAHGYWRRAESLERTARKLTGLPQEEEYLTRAADAYRQSLSLYKMAATSDVAERIRSAQYGLARVMERLEVLAEPIDEAPVVHEEQVPVTQ
jgi:serine/threonine protein kinase